MPAASSVRLPTRAAAPLLAAAIAVVGCACAAPVSPDAAAPSDGPSPSCRARQTETGAERTADSPVAWTISCAEPRGEGRARQRVRPRPGQVDVAPIAWQRARIGGDDRTVTLLFTSGVEPCSVLDHVETARTRDRLSITLFEGTAPGAGDVACIEIGVLKSVRVVLQHRLGGRELVDGARA